MIEYDKFQRALKHLELQFENYRTLDDGQPELIREAVAESVIQRFETCYDCMWKVMKRYLIEEIGLSDVPNGPKPLARLANENYLLKPDVEAWMDYINARIGTAHDYSGEKAKAALAIMGDFIRDAITLYQTMSGKPPW
ncbi:MAG: nucleotidyltransferase substrate binding protein [Methylococcaceae bacterium]|nr:nucleotidyltransferase substrate binding protein [Methylococcaceae bacterium]